MIEPDTLHRSRASIILAAGRSARMGSPKALLPWGASTLIQAAIDAHRLAGSHHIVVVLGHEAERIASHVPASPEVSVVVNDLYDKGRSSSIRAGADAVPDGVRTIIIQSVDQPCPGEIIRQLMVAIETSGNLLAMPTYDGRRGHPLTVSGRLLGELRVVEEASQGLRALVRGHAHSVRELQVATELVTLNINAPEDYEYARGAAARALGMERL